MSDSLFLWIVVFVIIVFIAYMCWGVGKAKEFFGGGKSKSKKHNKKIKSDPRVLSAGQTMNWEE